MNPSVLERQLVHMDLRKGMNERVRPECGDPSSMLTLVENLQQDQEGAWVKRAGLTALGGAAAFTSATRLVRLRNGGVAAIHGTGKLSVYAENYGWSDPDAYDTNYGPMPDFVVDADQVTSSADRSSSTIISFASNDKYHFVCTLIGGPSSAAYMLTTYDRATGSVVLKVNISDSSVVPYSAPALAMVANRYLHIWYHEDNGGGNFSLHCFVVDTNSSIGTYFLTPTATLFTLGIGPTALADIAVSSDRSYFLSDGSAGTATVYSVQTTGATTDSAALAGTLAIAATSTKLWYMTATNLGAQSLTTLATVSVASAAHGGASTSYMVATNADRVYQISENTAATFGGTTTTVLSIRRTTSDNGTTFSSAWTLDGWRLRSQPFFLSATGRVYVHLMKAEPGASNSMHAVANITSDLIQQNLSSGNSFYSYRVEAVTEPFNAIDDNTVPRVFSQSDKQFSIAMSIQTTARGLSYTFVNMRLRQYGKLDTAEFGNQSYIAGGVQSVLGASIREAGYIDQPFVNAADSGGAGNPDGAYKYVAAYRHVDETGAVTWSRLSPVASVTVVTNTITVTVCPPALSNRDEISNAGVNAPVTMVIELYRTLSGGTQYYLCASSSASVAAPTQALTLAASRFYAVTDDLSDVSLASQPLLFRQPGTPNTPLDHYPPPASKILIAHKDRLFTTNAAHGSVYYSSFFVDGETAWFHPQFNFYCHGGTGPITGMASMDGRLVVFKRNAVFVVDGDGPAEGGVSGNEFSPPTRVATEYGCVDNRSIVVFSGGIIYRSVRGIELLTRGLELRPIGDKVQETVLSHPKTVAAVMDSDGRYKIALAASDPDTQTMAGINGCVLSYDTQADCWSKHRYTNHGGTYGISVQDLSTAHIGNADVVVVAEAATGVRYEDTTTWLDNSTSFVPWVIETGWFRSGQQSRQRIEKLLFLGKKVTNHRITIDVAYDYVDSYTDTYTWEPDSINESVIEELIKNLAVNQTLAAKFKLYDSAPTDTTTYPVTTGKGCDILGLTVQVAVKTGAPKVASDQKG